MDQRRKLPSMLLAGHAKGVHHPSHLDKTDSYSKVLWKHSQFLNSISLLSHSSDKDNLTFQWRNISSKKLRLFNSLIMLVPNLPWDLHPNVFQNASCLTCKGRNKKTPLLYSGTKVLFTYSNGLNVTVLTEHLPTFKLMQHSQSFTFVSFQPGEDL